MNGCNPTPDKFDISGARPRRLDPHLERALTLALARRSLPCTFASSLTLVCTFPCLSFCLSLSLSLVFSSVNMPLPPTSFLLHVNSRSSGLSFLPVLRFSLRLVVYNSSEMEEKERKRGREIEKKINREGRHSVRGPIALAVFISRCKPANEGARARFFTAGRVGREECVWLKFQSRPSAFSAMKGGVEGKRTGQLR